MCVLCSRIYEGSIDQSPTNTANPANTRKTIPPIIVTVDLNIGSRCARGNRERMVSID